MAKRRWGPRGTRAANVRRGPDAHARRAAEAVAAAALDGFRGDLLATGMSDDMARRHLARASEFVEDCVRMEPPVHPLEAGPREAWEHLAVRAPLRDHRARPWHLRATLGTLALWYRFLAREGSCPRVRLEAVEALLADRVGLERRLWEHATLLARGDWGIGDLEAWAAVPPPGTAPPRPAVDVPPGAAPPLAALPPGGVPGELAAELRGHDIGGLAILDDLRLLLERAARGGLALNRTGRWLAASELAALDAARAAPEPVARAGDQQGRPVLNSVVAAARAMGLVKEDGGGGRLEATGAAAAFMALGPGERHLAMAHALWNGVPWAWLWCSAAEKDPWFAQDHRELLAALLLGVLDRYPLGTFLDATIFAMASNRAVTGSILPTLAALGLIERREGEWLAWEEGHPRLPAPTPLGRHVLAWLSPGVRDWDAYAAPVRAARGDRAMSMRFTMQDRPGVHRTIEVLGANSLQDLYGAVEAAFQHERVASVRITFHRAVRTPRGRANLVLDPGASHHVHVGRLGLGSDARMTVVVETEGPLDDLVHPGEVTELVRTDPETAYPREVSRNEPEYVGCGECDIEGEPPVARFYCHGCDVHLCEECAGEHDPEDLQRVVY